MKMITGILEMIIGNNRISPSQVEDFAKIVSNVLRKGARNSRLWIHAMETENNIGKIQKAKLKASTKTIVGSTLMVPTTLFTKLARFLRILIRYQSFKRTEGLVEAILSCDEYIKYIKAANRGIERRYGIHETSGYSDGEIVLAIESEPLPASVTPKAQRPLPPRPGTPPSPSRQHRPFTPPSPLQHRPGGRQRLGSDYEDPDEVNRQRAQMAGSSQEDIYSMAGSPGEDIYSRAGPSGSGAEGEDIYSLAGRRASSKKSSSRSKSSSSSEDPREELYAKVQKKKR
ncbi:hypothetical protein EIN_035490 [Entamoeba invadens IP1]|uniref:Uncharacterized protein n=1 Tax=Entamoeba invadens IP1 TaxID=370355 RepID=A0A0A1U3W3_ENTIV|nr:hypothetical protein EIN_035490 [Entamoeba invadens IP1]ELP86312.1 hypothetical protein EIN_035490 [Entamoeba invadens IP1]|eukprot:XP_004185658.1 hypothetical protein EIN_035490 [Entamoeba invadens IP1]